MSGCEICFSRDGKDEILYLRGERRGIQGAKIAAVFLYFFFQGLLALADAMVGLLHL